MVCMKRKMKDMMKMKKDLGMDEKMEKHYEEGEEMSEEDKQMMKEGMFGGDEEEMNELMRGKKECMGRAEEKKKQFYDDMEEMMCDEYPEMSMTDDDKMQKEKEGKEREERR